MAAEYISVADITALKSYVFKSKSYLKSHLDVDRVPSDYMTKHLKL